MHRPFEKRLSLVFLLIVGVIGAIGVARVMMVGGQGARLLGLMREVWHLAPDSSGPRQNATSTSQALVTYAVNRPFPQNLSYPIYIKPSNVTQADINNSIRSYYDYWKSTISQGVYLSSALSRSMARAQMMIERTLAKEKENESAKKNQQEESKGTAHVLSVRVFLCIPFFRPIARDANRSTNSASPSTNY
jgi:hypothetical protein